MPKGDRFDFSQPAPAAAPAPDGPWSDFQKPQAAPAAAVPSEQGPWADFQAQPPEESKLKTIARGALQGAVYDPVEGIGQLLEHYGAPMPIPQSVRQWFTDVHDKVQSTQLGRGSEVVSAIGSMLIPGLGEVGAGLRGAALAGRAGEAAGAMRALEAGRLATATVPREMRLGEMAQAAKGARELRAGTRASNAIPRLEAAEKAAGRPLTEAEQAEVIAGGEGPRAAPSPSAPASAPPGSIPGRMARGALGGAAAGAAQPVEDPNAPGFGQQKALQALAGATGGVVGGTGLASRGIGKVVEHARRHPVRSLAHSLGPLAWLHVLGLGQFTYPALGALAAAALAEKAGPRAVGAGAGQLIGGAQ